MTDYLEDACEELRREKEQLEKYCLHAKVFNFIFKDVLGDLLFSRRDTIMRYGKPYLLRFDLLYAMTIGRCSHFTVSADNYSDFSMYMEFTADDIDRLHRWFPKFATEFDTEKEFLYKEFPLKTLIEDALGRTLLHVLSKPYGNMKMFIENGCVPKQLFFSAANIEELMVKMDIG